MKRLVMTIALTLVLSSSALAGEIPCDAPAPPPPTPNQITSATPPVETPYVLGDLPTSGSPQQMSDAALFAFLSVLGWLVV